MVEFSDDKSTQVDLDVQVLHNGATVSQYGQQISD